MRRPLVLAAALAALLAGGVALAQQATNPVVVARQQVMKEIGGGMKVLGDMASGKAAFDGAAAGAAAARLAEAAGRVEETFAQNVTEPASEASPRIWTDWTGFAAQAGDLAAGARALDTRSLEGLKATLGAAGGTCRACHTDYRL